LKDAFTEIERLRDLLTDIIDLVHTSSKSAMVFENVAYSDSVALLENIENVAQGYFTVKQ
jgi:hypothetical protein